MGLSNSKATPSPPSDILMRYYFNNAPFRSTYRRQEFPFRDTLIRYITKNPASSKFYQKMIQSCKHFFMKNPIIIVSKLCFIRTKGWYLKGSRPLNDRPSGRSVYLNELKSKIWITDSLDVSGRTPNWPEVMFFTPQIYQCDATTVVIGGEQMFSFSDLMVIASKCEMLHLLSVVIMNNNEVVPETEGAAVSLEALFKALSNLKTFTYNLPYNSLNIITTKTAQELLKIRHFLSSDKFELNEIPEIFDITSFYGHIKENKKTNIHLDFSNQISDEYKTRLQTTVDEILETENRDYKVPWICFSGITRSSYHKMRALYFQN